MYLFWLLHTLANKGYTQVLFGKCEEKPVLRALGRDVRWIDYLSNIK